MTVRSDSSSGQWKPYPEYKNSGVEWLGEIPNVWTVSNVQRNYEIQLGKMLQNSSESENDVKVPYLKALNVIWQYVNIDDFLEMWASPNDLIQYGIIDGDLLVCEGGEVGRAAIVKNPPDPCVIQNALHRVRSRGNADLNFLQYVIIGVNNSGWFDVLCNKATISHFTREKFAELKIPVPPLPEQKEIASFLDERTARIDTIIEKKERQIELLKEKRSALISHAVTKGLDPDAEMKDSGVEWLGEIPVGWDVVQLKSIFKIVNGSTPKSSVPEYWDGDILWITPDDLGSINKPELTDSNRRITKEGYRSCGTSLVSKGSLVLSTRAPIGYLAIAGKQLCSNQGCRCLLFRSNDSEKYYYYLMFSSRPELESLGQGSTFKELSRDKLSSVKLVSPPLPEQKAIAAFLDRETERIDGLVGKVEASVSMLKEYRAALISAAVTGKIDVRGV